MKKTLLLAASLVSLALVLALQGPRLVDRGSAGPITNPADFRAFYCASRVLLERADPYRTEPLRACEHQAAAMYGLHVFEGLVLPAPLPPFALLGLAPLALLPFSLASPAWFLLCLLAVAATIAMVCRLSGAPLWGVALAFASADAYESLPNGQIVPLIALATCACALALRAGRRRTAAWLALATLGEPHLGAPLCLALFLWVPSMRRRLGVGVLLLGAISLVWAGAPVVHEYVAEVLPMHARSEITQLAVQYSLTALAYALGVSERAALSLGSLSYAVMLVLGLWLARRLAQAWGDDALLALTPPALVLLGGIFVHLHQMTVALPLGFVLLGRGGPAGRALAAAGTLCLALPWEGAAQLPALQARVAAGVSPASLAPRPVPPAPGGVLAEAAEISFTAAGGYGKDPRTAAELIAFKTPTWLALLALASAAGFSLRSRTASHTRGFCDELLAGGVDRA